MKNISSNFAPEYNLILTQSQFSIKKGQLQNLKKKQLENQLEILELTKGSSFWNLEEDFSAIYDNFNLLSYMSSTCKVRILDRFEIKLKNNQGNYDNVKIDIFSIRGQDSLVLVEKGRTVNNFYRKEEANKNKERVPQITQSDTLKIKYELYPKESLNIQQKSISYSKKLGQIVVEFTTKIPIVEQDPQNIGQNPHSKLFHVRNNQIVTESHRQYIFIKIKDINGLIKRTFEGIEYSNHHRISEKKKAKINEVEYFYIEPQSQRFKVFDEEHISLAFQGGGVKGVQYVGAQRAILQQFPNLKVKTIIGSSIGALIGAAVCCGLTPNEISQLIIIDKLSNSAQDKKFKKLTKQNRTKMNQLFLQIVNWLEQYKILEEQLIEKLRVYLQDPTQDQQLENIIIQFLKGTIDPVIRNLFIDTEEEEQKNFQNNDSSTNFISSTRNFKQHEKNNKIKKQRLNFYGLLNASLMTGEISSISTVICLAKCLFNLWKKRKQTNQQNYQSLSSEDEKKYKVMQKYPELSEVTDSKLIDESTCQRLSKLTMKELYYLTGIQFTCTSVDMKNHVLRFFNQKTTPDLPVAKAVQMSASFPVAFQAQSWKKQWGKYYIHYDNIRKEIDLTGVKFTDGGTLSNLPIKYLDNQQMRPMYFSHVKTATTKMYGIGFIPDYKKPENQDSNCTDKFKQKIVNLIKYRIGKWIAIKSWMKSMNCGQSRTYQIQIPQKPFKAFTEIPLVKFILDLLFTLYKTRNNLNQECFSHSTYETTIDKNYLNQLINCHGSEFKNKKIQEVYNSLIGIFNNNKLKEDEVYGSYKSNVLKLERKDIYFNQSKILNNQKQPSSCYRSLYLNESRVFKNANYISNNLLTLIQQILSFCPTQKEKQQILQFLNYLIKQQSFRLSGVQNIEMLMEKLGEMKNQKIFYLSQIQEDLEFIGTVSVIILEFCEKLNQHSQYSFILNMALSSIHKIEQGEFKMAMQSLSKNNINHIQLEQILNLSSIGLVTPFHLLNQVKYLLRSSKVPQLFINLNSKSNSVFIKSYVLNRINNYVRNKTRYNFSLENKENKKQIDEESEIYEIVQIQLQDDGTKILRSTKKKSDMPKIFRAGIHILLQSIPMCQLYFHTYYRHIKDTIHQYNQINKRKIKNYNKNHIKNQEIILEPLKVTTMTSTGYHSLVMFLHASDLRKERIEQEIWNLKDLIKFDIKKIIQEYNNGSWTKIDSVLMREMQNKTIEKQKDIFKYLEYMVTQSETQQVDFQILKSKINEQIKNTRLSNEEMSDAINNSLNYVVKELMEIEKKKMNKKEAVQALIEKLSLNIHPKSEFNQIKAGEVGLKRLSQYFGHKFGDLIKYIFYESSFISEHITNLLKPEQRKQAWRIGLMSGVISGTRIKDYVIKILAQMNFGPDTTLKQFYEMTSKKIQLNFCVVEQQFFTIYNHFTRPNMPLWAVILATASIPEFFSPVIDRPEWKYKTKHNYKQRQIESHFAGHRRPPFQQIHSSQILSSFPLDLLQNNAFRNIITENKQEIFLCFNFSQYQIAQQKYYGTFEVSPITIGDLLNIFYKIIPNVRRKLSKQEENLKGVYLIKRLNAVKTKLNVLNLYVESHDNLILRLYKRQIILNPIRFETLQFNRVLATIPDPQNPNKTICTTSDLCQDSIMQTCYILTEKIRNRKALDEKMPINSLTEGSRILFMRAESIMDSKTKKIQVDKLKIRFLSMLNPQREYQERFAIYYQQIKEDKSISPQFTRLYKEDIEVLTPKLELKIEYVSAKEAMIKTGHFLLDFSELFDLAKKCRFGFIYPLFFDKIYGFENKKEFLISQDYWKIDYMNKNSQITSPPKIGISSLIRGSLFETILCHKCTSILRITEDSEGHPVFRCSCSPINENYSTIVKYDLRFDTHEKKFLCPLDHSLSLVKQNQKTSNHQLKTSFEDKLKAFFRCNFCERKFNEIWRDEICQLQFCQKCRATHMDIIQN